MAQIMIPQKKDDTSQLLSLGGAAIGGVLGGPPGAMAGMSLGGAVGGAASNNTQPQALASNGQTDAMARRQEQMATDNLEALKQSEQALAYMPEKIRQQYAPPIIQARMLEEQNRGLA